MRKEDVVEELTPSIPVQMLELQLGQPLHLGDPLDDAQLGLIFGV
jgi:hypothetical protein